MWIIMPVVNPYNFLMSWNIRRVLLVLMNVDRTASKLYTKWAAIHATIRNEMNQ